MRDRDHKVRIVAGYSSCCFCDKPDLPPGPPVPCQPRFEFRKAAREYAAAHGLRIVRWWRGKSAAAELAYPCQHRQVQQVCLNWTFA